MKEDKCFYCRNYLDYDFWHCEHCNKLICKDCNKKVLPCERETMFSIMEHIHHKSYFSGDDIQHVDQLKLIQSYKPNS